MASAGRTELHPNTIGQFFRLQSCPMYLQWEVDEDAQDEINRRPWEAKSLSPVLSGEGNEFELEQLAAVQKRADEVYGPAGTDTSEYPIEFTATWKDTTETALDRTREIIDDVAGSADQTTVIHQPYLSGQIGAYPISGKGDILVLEGTTSGLKARFYEVKSSSEQKVYHRYQATTYALMLEQTFTECEVIADRDDITTAIVTPDNNLFSGLPEPFDIDPYAAKLEIKLEAGGSFDQTLRETDFDDTTNRIAGRCSGCEYESFCLTRGVEQKGLELLGLQTGTQQALHELGVTDIDSPATCI